MVSEREIEINKNRKFSELLKSVIDKFTLPLVSATIKNEKESSMESITKFEQRQMLPSLDFRGKLNKNEQMLQTDFMCSSGMLQDF